MTHFLAILLLPAVVRTVRFSFHITDSYLIVIPVPVMVRIVRFSFHTNNSILRSIAAPSCGIYSIPTQQKDIGTIGQYAF